MGTAQRVYFTDSGNIHGYQGGRVDTVCPVDGRRAHGNSSHICCPGSNAHHQGSGVQRIPAARNITAAGVHRNDLLSEKNAGRYFIIGKTVQGSLLLQGEILQTLCRGFQVLDQCRGSKIIGPSDFLRGNAQACACISVKLCIVFNQSSVSPCGDIPDNGMDFGFQILLFLTVHRLCFFQIFQKNPSLAAGCYIQYTREGNALASRLFLPVSVCLQIF